MEKELKIGIVNLSLSWQTVLNQIGVSYCEIPANGEIPLHLYSLIIVNRSVTNKEFDILKEYIRDGGAIIDTGYCITSIVNGVITRKNCNCIIPDSLPFPSPFGIFDIYSTISIFSKAQHLNKTLFIDNYGKGVISFFGLNIDTLLFNTRSRRKYFYASLPRFPHEETACVSKGEITQLIFFLMRYLHTSRGLPFIHKWFFPNQAKNVFLFRIDSDYGTKKQVQQWYDIAQECKIKYTWFLHVAAHKEWLELFSDFQDHEIAIHAYDHFATKKLSNHKRNIEKALHSLQEKGFNCTGYAAPYGLWNPALNTACEYFDFTYSSEFSYIYDSLPMHPVVNNKKSSVLQIPIHPICTGNLLTVKADDKKSLDYFIHELNRKIAVYNPLIFYDHVIHSNPDVLKELFKNIHTLNIPTLTFLEFAQWWNRRERTNFSAQIDSKGQINITSSHSDNESFFCIWNTDNTYILTNRDTTVNLSTHPSNEANYDIHFDIIRLKKTRKFNPNLYKCSLLEKLFWRKYRYLYYLIFCFIIFSFFLKYLQ